jgi:hypothetical protein
VVLVIGLGVGGVLFFNGSNSSGSGAGGGGTSSGSTNVTATPLGNAYDKLACNDANLVLTGSSVVDVPSVIDAVEHSSRLRSWGPKFRNAQNDAALSALVNDLTTECQKLGLMTP